MTVRFRCPRCQKVLSAPEEKAGVQVRCSGCKQSLQVPSSPQGQQKDAATSWYYMKSGERHGPVSEADLKGLTTSGQLQPSDLVWQPGKDKWVPLGSVKELAPQTSSPVATAASTSATASTDTATAPTTPRSLEKMAELAAWGKGLWRRTSRGVKIGIIGGTIGSGLLVLTLCCFLPLRWFFAGSTSRERENEVAGTANDPKGRKEPGAAKSNTGKVGRSWVVFRTFEWKHKFSPEEVAFLPDGNTLAVCGTSVRLFDLASGTEVELEPELKDSTRYSHITSSTSGPLLAWCKHQSSGKRAEDCGVKLWDAATKKLVGQVVHTKLSVKGTPYVALTNQCFSSDGRVLVTSSGVIARAQPPKDNIKVWDTSTLTLRADLPGYGNAAISSDGKVLAMHGREPSAVVLWSLEAGKEIITISVPRGQNPDDAVPGIALHPDGKTLTTSNSKGIILWDAVTGQTRRQLVDYKERKNARYYKFRFSPDGKKLVAMAELNEPGRRTAHVIKVWDMDTWKVATLRGSLTFSIYGLAFSAKGAMIAITQADKRIHIFKEEREGGTFTYRERDDEPIDAPQEVALERFDRSKATRQEFVTKMQAVLAKHGWGEIMKPVSGPEGTFTLANYEYDAFMGTFGQPDTGYKAPDQMVNSKPVYLNNANQSWLFRCKDGRVMMRVELGYPRLIVRELRLMD